MGQMRVLHLFLLGVSIVIVRSCSLNGYVEMGIMERFVQSDYVVYGSTVNHQANKVKYNKKHMYVIDAVFHVYCVLKRGETNIGEIITVSGIAPRDDCSGTLVNSLMRVGDHAIIALKKSTDGQFIFHEIMPKTSAAIRAYKPYFFSLSKICDMQSWEPPSGVIDNKCPICGTNNFVPEVETLDNSYNQLTTCPATQNAAVSNMTTCDLYMEYSIDEANSQTCVPASFAQTCTLLLHRTASATCDCSPKDKQVTVGVGAGQIMLPSAFMTVLVFSSLLNNINIM